MSKLKLLNISGDLYNQLLEISTNIKKATGEKCTLETALRVLIMDEDESNKVKISVQDYEKAIKGGYIEK